MECGGSVVGEQGRRWGDGGVRGETRGQAVFRMECPPLPSLHRAVLTPALNKSNTPPKSPGDCRCQQVEADGRESKWKEWLTSKGLSLCQDVLNSYLEIVLLGTSIING